MTGQETPSFQASGKAEKHLAGLRWETGYGWMSLLTLEMPVLVR